LRVSYVVTATRALFHGGMPLKKAF